MNTFLATTFLHMATENKILVTSWRLPKIVNFEPCNNDDDNNNNNNNNN